MYEQTYQLGTLTLTLACHKRQQQQVGECWQQLFRLEPRASLAPNGPKIAIRLQPAGPGDCAAEAAPRHLVAAFNHLQIWQSDSGFQFTCGKTVIDIVQAQAVGYLADDFWDYSLIEQRDFWLRIFARLVRQADGYLLHANALYHPTQGAAAGVLLVGDCGAGKTTLTLSLISAGWGYVTDDSVLLQLVDNDPASPGRQADQIMAYTVRRGFACTQQTAAQWPWLAALQATGFRLNRAKTLVDLDSLYPASFAPACWPRLLLFPRISGGEQSRLTRLSPSQSFTTLLGQPRSGILADPATTPLLLALFKGLVQQTQGYQLDLGLDVFTQPDQVSALFTRALETM